MKNYTHWSALIVGMLGFVASPTLAPAQSAGPRPPQIVSPQVQKDGTVLFQLRAPKAQSVSLNSPDLGGLPAPGEMTKNDEGVWSLTYGPVTEGVALRYRFNVDGVDFADPSARGTSEANGTVFSLVTIPGAEFQDTRQVPHGAVAEVQYYSNVLGAFRRLHVYTPPGYEKDQKTYPVLYLLHGSSDSDDSWSTIGRANDILDNLIAAKKVRPLVVVFVKQPLQTRNKDLSCSESFATFLAKDLIPWARSEYHVSADPKRSIIGGLSLGGLMASYCGLNHPDVFGNGLSQSGAFWFSPGIDVTAPPVLIPEGTLATDFLNAPVPASPTRFYLEVGRFEDDFPSVLLSENRRFRDVLRAKGYPVTYAEYSAGHSYLHWRGSLPDGLIALLSSPSAQK